MEKKKCDQIESEIQVPGPDGYETVEPLMADTLDESETAIISDDHESVDQKEDENVITSFEELEEEMGDVKPHRLEFNDIEDLTEELDEEGNLPEPPPQLDMSEIAEIAHNTVAFYNAMMFPKNAAPLFSELSEEDQISLRNEVHEIMQTASNPDDVGVAKMKYAQRAMSLMAQGYKFGMVEDEEKKETRLVMPWEYLPNEYRMPVILFRNVAKTLVMSVWSGI